MSSVQDTLGRQFATLLRAQYPPFIFVRDLSAADVACSLLRSILEADIQAKPEAERKPLYAIIDCIACFNARLLFDSILIALINCLPTSECTAKQELFTTQRNETFDDFLHNIRLLFPGSSFPSSSLGSGSIEPVKIVLIFKQAERLKDTLPRFVHPLSRLQERTRQNITTIFISDTAWETISPVAGALLDPYMIDVDPLDGRQIIEGICQRFPTDIPSNTISMYNPSLEGLFRQFVETVYNVCSPFISSPVELGYIVAARWPGFVAPVLEDWRYQYDDPYAAPSEEARLRLMRLFNSSLMHAVENLYPRSMNRTEWSTANSFPEGFRLSQSLGAQLPSGTNSAAEASAAIPSLAVNSMFIVVAAFLASYNPPKTDYRMFGRGVDEKSRRRRKGGGTRKTKPGTVARLPQRLIGPTAFSYDRLIAILGSLLREYGDLNQVGQSVEDVSELKAEVDVYRVQTSATIRELVSMHLLHHSTAQEKLDAPTYRCGIGYDQALSLARKLGIPLTDLLWEPN
ncbi:uncharacterized protein FOMMEDRAFT_144006 [Fomitiporia mediterranea MF3/22]|uniref:uncharacterized protein n=1 Tax=Fomitiporia mediterranea (strain MF3/22) TaxID=694068 RepID=UPI0004409BA0|nr:uncharacterized protein FOMMEDRAFT_144006 [Fomitiporia mediterranea MF3/22]EJD07730.1 hypothetical protein FOMMEDRAFT_144006 [Fomitiporia mediterranea MF3/22]